ncbi:hypothetical protein [Haladaptatus cibarius]|uniref:hypothetical protein n=1 Tax=Haladaptatus cibarius TaxID=453847 RepID=UPI0006788F65|nr:hypothetical protein [Haladaptatus cibarius]
MTEETKENPTYIAIDDAHIILSNQLDTYHHIQNLAQNTIRILIAGLAIVIGFITKVILERGFPTIPSEEQFKSAGGQAGAGLELVVNIFVANTFISICLLFIALVVFFHSMILISRAITNKPLKPATGKSEKEILELVDSNAISEQERFDQGFGAWIDANKKLIAEADEFLSHGLQRLIISLILAIYGLILLYSSFELDLGYLVYFNSFPVMFILAAIIGSIVKIVRYTYSTATTRILRIEPIHRSLRWGKGIAMDLRTKWNISLKKYLPKVVAEYEFKHPPNHAFLGMILVFSLTVLILSGYVVMEWITKVIL